MLADLLLPFPTSHPSTVPSDLIHPLLRNGTPSLLSLVLLLVCASFFSCSSSFSSLISFYILHFDLFSVLLPSPLSSFLFNLDFHSLSLLYVFSPYFPSLFLFPPSSLSIFGFFLSSLTFFFTRNYSLDSKYYDIVVRYLDICGIDIFNSII